MTTKLGGPGKLYTKTVDRLLEIGLRIAGVWPQSRYLIVHKIAWILMVGPAQFCQYRYIMLHFDHQDLSELMDSLSLTLTYSTISVKLLIFWFKRRYFRDIISAMEEDQNEYPPCDWRTRIMSENADFAERCSKYIFSAYYISLVLIATGTTVRNSEATQRKQLVKMAFPFEATSAPTYEIITLLQAIHQLIMVSTDATTDAMIVKLMLHMGGRIDIICKELSEMSSKTDKESVDSVKVIVGRHYKIIKFAEDIESIFSYPMLVRLMLNTLLLCVLGFALVTSLKSTQGSMLLLKLIPYYAAGCANVFICCFSSEYLATKSQSVADAAYETSWYNSETSVKYGLLLLILRSQKRLTITVGKFADLSYECFTTMLKASASYTSVLHAMY